MILNEKAKYYFFLFAKIAIALFAFYFIYQKILIQPWADIESKIAKIDSLNLLFLIPIFLISFINWVAEIYKWQFLSSFFKPISFKESCRIVLSSFAVSTITPNRVGDYGAKIVYYDKLLWKKILSFNFSGNMMQLLTTLLMVVVSYFFLPDIVIDKLPTIGGYFFIFTASITLFVFLFKTNLKLSLPWISKNIELSLWRSVNFKSRLNVLAISIVRYLAFSIQFLLILSVFENENTLSLFPVIALYYLIVSVVPTIFILDLLIKGSVSIFLFSLVSVDEMTIIAVVLLAWIFNFVLPTITGVLLLFRKE
ncbi:MAG: hypothetical protein KAG37_08290 [Flavobacteriales bacterium]|nr:hypothetical protein [Flavobacteriales bacterium]